MFITGVQWVEARDTAKYCILSWAAHPTTENNPVQNDDSAEVGMALPGSFTQIPAS